VWKKRGRKRKRWKQKLTCCEMVGRGGQRLELYGSREATSSARECEEQLRLMTMPRRMRNRQRPRKILQRELRGYAERPTCWQWPWR
jgi:hypothetical protein